MKSRLFSVGKIAIEQLQGHRSHGKKRLLADSVEVVAHGMPMFVEAAFGAVLHHIDGRYA